MGLVAMTAFNNAHADFAVSIVTGDSSGILDLCGVSGFSLAVVDSTNQEILTLFETFCSVIVRCDSTGVASLTIQEFNFGEPGAKDVFNITCTMFVLPESPIGIIALTGSSLAALGGFIIWKRRQGNNQPHSIGDLGI